MDDVIVRRLDRLESIETIRRLIAQYAHAADRKNDPGMMGMLYHEDAHWSAPGFAEFRGRDAITAGLRALAEQSIVWTLHFMVSPHVDVSDDGESADVHWYLWELATQRDEHGADRNGWLGGTYQTRWSRKAGRWAMDSCLLEVKIDGTSTDGWNKLSHDGDDAP